MTTLDELKELCSITAEGNQANGCYLLLVHSVRELICALESPSKELIDALIHAFSKVIWNSTDWFPYENRVEAVQAALRTMVDYLNRGK